MRILQNSMSHLDKYHFHDLHDAAVNQSVTRCLLNLSDEHAALKLSVTHYDLSLAVS